MCWIALSFRGLFTWSDSCHLVKLALSLSHFASNMKERSLNLKMEVARAEKGW